MARPLRQLAENLWVAERRQAFYGLEVGTRMTVMRLRGGRLLLHSPVELDAGLRAELDALGQVSYTVAPNRLHHLYAGAVEHLYPQARLWIGPGLERKRPDLRYVAILGDEAPEEWRDEVGQIFFAGRPYENEVAFFHRPSRTLILCDLAGHFGPSKLDPFLIRDRAGARRSLERILEWDFDRVIVAHGDILETGGHAQLRDGYAWLLR